MEDKELKLLVDELVLYPNESEWLEFKHNFHSNNEIGQRISALSNSALLNGKEFGYLVFGVEDKSHNIIGTDFSIKSAKKGDEELENWLIQRLNPRIDFKFYEFNYSQNIRISLIVIPAAISRPVKFLHKAYIRIGSYTRLLGEFPQKEAKIWGKKDNRKFENRIAKFNLSENDIVSLLDTQSYFDLIKLPYPSTRNNVIEKFISENFIVKNFENYSITNLGAILFAKNLNDFLSFKHKSIRVIVYKGKSRIETVREQNFEIGYILIFKNLINWVNGQLPANEEIGKAFRNDKRMYPEIAIRELVANSIIHQDFDENGRPMIEIFSDRIEISNPGIPLITPERFIDEYQARNEALADIMRRLGICEEKGSGIDKVIYHNEVYQLPAPIFQVQEKHTRTILFSYKSLNKMDRNDKIRACYQHCCLKYVSNDKMTNQSLRERFKIESRNAAIASRIIKEALNAKVIKEDNPESNSRKYKKYIPFWA